MNQFGQPIASTFDSINVRRIKRKQSDYIALNEDEIALSKRLRLSNGLYITNNDDIQHSFSEDGALSVNNGTLHVRHIIMDHDVPWYTLTPYEYYTYSSNNTLVEGKNPDGHVIYPTQTFQSVGNTESIFTEFQIVSAPSGFDLSLGVVVASLRTENNFYGGAISGINNGLTISTSNITFALNDIIRLELKPSNDIVVYKNGTSVQSSNYSQRFMSLRDHHSGADTTFSWYLMPHYTNSLQTFRIKLLDSWSASDLHNEAQIDCGFNTLFFAGNDSQNNQISLMSMDHQSIDAKVPFRLRHVSTVSDMLNLSTQTRAMVHCDELNAVCIHDANSGYWQLNSPYQNKRLTTKNYSLHLSAQYKVFTELEIEFVAIQPKYHIHVSVWVEDLSNITATVIANLRDMNFGFDDTWSPAITIFKGNPTGFAICKFSILMTTLVIGTSYRIAPVFRKNASTDNIYVRSASSTSGTTYPYAYIQVEPLGVHVSVTD